MYIERVKNGSFKGLFCDDTSVHGGGTCMRCEIIRSIDMRLGVGPVLGRLERTQNGQGRKRNRKLW